ncbi:hypothetical protein [Cystobacter ferrugineus]|uniref:Uncharacterized protein n=1 Tax=Cystobacter ferrugineus TaxID=83449 RepID=A0A1L9BBT5_9BACT|nr:hypothetical protein [Cystobacter ferrugineus]OJH39701.1 hypothetical protein BON30_19710 [Cystobacter ferrugineus]
MVGAREEHRGSRVEEHQDGRAEEEHRGGRVEEHQDGRAEGHRGRLEGLAGLAGGGWAPGPDQARGFAGDPR